MKPFSTDRAKERENAAALRSVPQKKIPPYEFVIYAAAFLLFVAAGAMPTVAVFSVPLIVPALYLLYRRFGAYFPTACLLFYGVLVLTLNYDILSVVYLCGLCFAFFGIVLSVQLRPYLLCAAVAFAMAVVGGLCGLGIVRLAERQPMPDIVTSYIVAEGEDPVIEYFARRAYETDSLPPYVEKLEETDEGYAAAAIEYYSQAASDEITESLPYYCIHIGGLVGAIAYFFALFVNRRTLGAYDADADDKNVRSSTRCLGGAVREKTQVRAMKCPRAYLWSVLLPAFVVTLALDIAGGYDMLAASIMHAFITMPSAFFFVTLLFFFASKFKRKARVAAYIVAALVLIAMCVVPVVLFACSLLGLCDIILNLRYWTEYLSKD